MEVHKVFRVILFEIAILVNFVHFCWCTNDLEEWRMNERRFKNFSCSIPQPRAFKLEELVDASELPDLHSQVFPKMTVLHVCDSHAGCCGNSMKACAPHVTEDVTLTFRIFSKLNKRNAEKPTNRFLHITVTNHTACSCQSIRDLPK